MPIPQPMWTEFILGSNVVQNCSGVLIADGSELFYLERGQRDDQLLLSVDVFDGTGSRLAKLRRNAWAYHQETYEVTTAPGSLVLSATGTGDVLLSAKVHSRDCIEVDGGSLYAAEGTHVAISPDKLVIGGTITLSRNTVSGMNSAFFIARDAFTIGVGPGGPPQQLLAEAALGVLRYCGTASGNADARRRAAQRSSAS